MFVLTACALSQIQPQVLEGKIPGDSRNFVEDGCRANHAAGGGYGGREQRRNWRALQLVAVEDDGRDEMPADIIQKGVRQAGGCRLGQRLTCSLAPRKSNRMLSRNWLEIDYLRGVDLDDPRTTSLRRRAIRENTFLSQIYEDWYARIVASIPEGPGRVVELGSGAGFLSERLPGLITTETFHLNGMSLIVDGRRMPFSDGALKAVAMTNVLHHIPDVRQFFREVSRVVRPGGVVSMIEPWVSEWSELIYTRLHHEPFDTTAESWEFASAGPLSGANGALPWMVFGRDRIQFEREFRDWGVKRVTPFMPFAYLLSGGVSMRQLMPGWSYRTVRWFESVLEPMMPRLAMFAHIVMMKELDARTD